MIRILFRYCLRVRGKNLFPLYFQYYQYLPDNFPDVKQVISPIVITSKPQIVRESTEAPVVISKDILDNILAKEAELLGTTKPANEHDEDSANLTHTGNRGYITIPNSCNRYY